MLSQSSMEISTASTVCRARPSTIFNADAISHHLLSLATCSTRASTPYPTYIRHTTTSRHRRSQVRLRYSFGWTCRRRIELSGELRKSVRSPILRRRPSYVPLALGPGGALRTPVFSKRSTCVGSAQHPPLHVVSSL